MSLGLQCRQYFRSCLRTRSPPCANADFLSTACAGRRSALCTGADDLDTAAGAQAAVAVLGLHPERVTALTVEDAGGDRDDPARTVLRVEGFGPAMPLDCDDTYAGRQVNRRVEVWLR